MHNHWKDEDFVLNEIHDDVVMSPINLKPYSTPPGQQLAMTLYRLATGCSYLTLSHLLGVSVSAANKFFNKVCQVLVAKFYDPYVYLPSTGAELEAEVRGFLENYEFPCVDAWNSFHIYISSKLKCFFSFKKRYTLINLGLGGYRKRFLYAVVGAPGSTHYVRLLKDCLFLIKF